MLKIHVLIVLKSEQLTRIFEVLVEKQELPVEKKIISLNSEECENLEQLDNRVKASYDKIDGSFVCKFCSKTFNKVFNVKEHVEIHFDGLSFPCDLCDKTFRSRHNLRSHRNH